MNKTTFGNFPSALKLVEVLTKYPKLVKRVSRIIGELQNDLYELPKLKNKTRHRIFPLLREAYLDRVDTIDNDEVKRFTKSVLTAYFRMFLESKEYKE